MLKKLEEIALESVELGAIAAAKLVGMNDKNSADEASVRVIREFFNLQRFSSKIVIGEGERDKAPMLYIGETLGNGEYLFDIAVDPLEGTNLCAQNKPNSFSVLAIGSKGTILSAPDIYMQKIATNIELPQNLINFNNIEGIIEYIARCQHKKLSDISVCILDRMRHEKFIDSAKKLGCSVTLIEDGDILACIETTNSYFKYDLYFGTGGAPEGVLAASALKCLNGHLYTKFAFNNEEEKKYAQRLGIKKLDKTYHIKDIVSEDIIFVACAVTENDYFSGVKKNEDKLQTSSLVLNSKTGQVKIKQTTHNT